MARSRNKTSAEQLLVQLAIPLVIMLVFARMFHSPLTGMLTFVSILGLLGIGLALAVRLQRAGESPKQASTDVRGRRDSSRADRTKNQLASPAPSPAMEAAIAEAMHPRQQASSASAPQTFTEETLRRMDWLAFEHLVLNLFRFLGFDVRKTPAGADGGVDIELHDVREQTGSTLKAVIQCKSRATASIGVDKARELFGVMAAKKVKRGILICNTSFTPDAEAFAKDAPGLQLADLRWLQKQLANLSEADRMTWEQKYLGPDYDVPSCPQCEIKLVRRTGRQGEFWGCSNYPRGCRFKMPMRTEAKLTERR